MKYTPLLEAGNAPGSLDASNIFNPALARGEIQCIGATTLSEYRKNIEYGWSFGEKVSRRL